MSKVSYDEVIELAVEKIKNGEVRPDVSPYLGSSEKQMRVIFYVYVTVEGADKEMVS